jgi:Reverse transcriptase (RNA-dependent DNA polymerase)
VRWLKTIGTNRKACVILENGKVSNIFDLMKGTAQGDCPSPIIYNICAQILLFKIELDPSIRRLPVGPEGGGINIQNNPNYDANGMFNNENFYQTGKNESFADDSTTFTYFAYEDLLSLKQILTDFSVLSGLKCNFEKTSIMRIGNIHTEIDPRILTLGFEITNNCKLLGFEIVNNGEFGHWE